MINLRRTGCALCALLMLISPTMAEQTFTGDQILQVEQALYSLGYHDENFDGLLDDATRSALRSFQKANGLTVTGEIDQATLQCLSGGTAVTCHEYLTNLALEYDNLPVLQSGSVGTSVSQLQGKLKELGYFTATSDGVYGEATSAAVCRFQVANGLTENGIADRATQYRLYEGNAVSWNDFVAQAQCASGDSGEHVRLLQRTLKDLGYYQGSCTGNFGEMTRLAVTQFQSANLLAENGAADANTCALLYSGVADTASDAENMSSEMDSTAVAELQSALAALGYFDRNITGIYGATTQTAVRLFQMANGLSATGSADSQTLSSLNSGNAASLSDVSERFSEELSAQDDSARAVVGATAVRMRGRSFEADDEDLYRGFAFVQYVCVASGLPVVSPESLMSMMTETVEDVNILAEGDILALTQGSTVLLAISSGSGRAVYALPDSGWVLESDLREMEYTELVRWSMTE